MLNVNKELIDNFENMPVDERLSRLNKMTVEELEVLASVGYRYAVNDGRITGYEKEDINDPAVTIGA